MGYYTDFLFDNAITWTTDGANAGTVRFRGEKFYCTNVCGVLLSENGYSNKAVAEALNLEAWKHVSKGGNPKLMNNVMGEIEITIPLTIAEHKRIGSLLYTLDNLITLHQRKPFNGVKGMHFHAESMHRYSRGMHFLKRGMHPRSFVSK